MFLMFYLKVICKHYCVEKARAKLPCQFLPWGYATCIQPVAEGPQVINSLCFSKMYASLSSPSKFSDQMQICDSELLLHCDYCWWTNLHCSRECESHNFCTIQTHLLKIYFIIFSRYFDSPFFHLKNLEFVGVVGLTSDEFTSQPFCTSIPWYLKELITCVFPRWLWLLRQQRRGWFNNV